jgi:hypothetical protein
VHGRPPFRLLARLARSIRAFSITYSVRHIYCGKSPQ